MDIAAMSMVMSQTSLVQNASLSVMKIAMDSAKMSATNLTEMLSQNTVIQQSVQPHLGGNFDVKV
ncbi:YjfB family protein [Paenibacillus sp. 2RAB27]|uniref:YjfB family protein n=1 Tax=Paenibacillus sp. 2RAB27 TaxID=3232991 RepID=UPI003F99788C